MSSRGGGRMHQLDKAAKPLSPCFGEFLARSDRRPSQHLFQQCTFAHHKQQGGECTSFCRPPSVGTTPLGPLSPLFLDLRPTSTLGKKKTYRNPWDGPPPSSARVPEAAGGMIIPAGLSRRASQPHSGEFSS